MQQITIIGHLGKDAVIKSNPSNDLLTFNVCVTEKYKDKNDQPVERSTWYGCVYRKTALAAYLKKGDKVMIQGELQAKLYVNERRETSLDLSVAVGRIELLTKKNTEVQGNK